jgi:ABC-type sugar transport system ATPase subunit
MYEQPKTPFAATFIGSPPMNLIPAQVKKQDGSTTLTVGSTTIALPPERADQVTLRKPHVLLGVRAEHVTLCTQGDRETLAGTVTTIEPLGRETLVHVGTDCGEILVLSDQRYVKVEETVHVSFNANRVHVFDDEQDVS